MASRPIPSSSPTASQRAIAPWLPEHAVVKWESPASELVGLARIAMALVQRGHTQPPRIGFAVPNRTWGLQLHRACTAESLPALLTTTPLERGMRQATIMDFRTAWLSFEVLFVVGCVEGLIPTAAALDDPEEAHRQEEAFLALAQAPCTVVLSTFAALEQAVADRIRVPYRRTAVNNGQPWARVSPTAFIDALGAARPNSLSGQQLLRNAGLN